DNWATRLAPFLSREAQAAYWALDDEAVRDYRTVKSAILKLLGGSPETYQCKFHSEPFASGACPWGQGPMP
ncbi:hypothetical protein UY3_15287, partial [Chelonia mydas]